MCDCIEKVNEALALNDAMLETVVLCRLDSDKMLVSLPVPLLKLSTGRRKTARSLSVTFCPFCGERSVPKA